MLSIKELHSDSYLVKRYMLKHPCGERLFEAQAGDQIRRIGDEEHELYVLVEGVAHSLFHNVEGKESSVGIYMPNSLLGVNFSPQMHISTQNVEMLTPGKFVGIQRRELPNLYQDPQALAELIATAGNDSERIRRLVMARNNGSPLDRTRHIMFLLTNDGQIESPRISQENIARLIDSSRSHVSNSLGVLRDMGQLERVNGITRGSFRFTKEGRQELLADLQI